jgi:uncharacterized membrane protein
MKTPFMSLGLCSLMLACSDEPLTAEPVEPIGSLTASISTSSNHDVRAVRFRVVRADQSCADDPMREETVTLVNNHLAGDEAATHSSADALFILTRGEYRVCAQPLKDDGSASAECAPVEKTAQVFAGLTTEIVLVSQCSGEDSGGLDVTTVFNDPPQIDDVTIEPGQSLGTCQQAVLSATASDPNRDPLSYTWELVTGTAEFSATGNTARFTATSTGEYNVRLTVVDVHDATASLRIPLHVSKGVCASFQWLAPMGVWNEAYAVSADGSTVTGTITSSSDPESHVFRWKLGTGLVDLGRRGAGFAVSSDGSAIAGELRAGGHIFAFRWTEASGWLDLEPPGAPAPRGSHATDISADGNVVVGEYNGPPEMFNAFRWTESMGMVFISGGVRWSATATSDDGTVVVGYQATASGGLRAVRWTASSGLVAFLGTSEESDARDVSGDGLVIIGRTAPTAPLGEAFRWTEAGGLTSISEIGTPEATNADGSVVVGGAMLWDSAHGVRTLRSVLEENGVDLSGCQVGPADISADGRTIVGNGGCETGFGGAWIAHLP